MQKKVYFVPQAIIQMGEILWLTSYAIFTFCNNEKEIYLGIRDFIRLKINSVSMNLFAWSVAKRKTGSRYGN